MVHDKIVGQPHRCKLHTGGLCTLEAEEHYILPTRERGVEGRTEVLGLLITVRAVSDHLLASDCSLSLDDSFIHYFSAADSCPVLSPELQAPISKCHSHSDASLASQTQLLLSSHSLPHLNRWCLSPTSGPLHWLFPPPGVPFLHNSHAPSLHLHGLAQPAPSTPDLSYSNLLFFRVLTTVNIL